MMAALPTGLRSVSVLLCVATVMCMVTPVSRAQEDVAPTAERIYKEGLEEYRAQRFHKASALLAQSFEMDPQPQALFAWAQSERFLFHCEKAALLFDRFIAISQTEQQTAAAELAKRRCGAPPVSSAVVPLPNVPAPGSKRPVWYTDILGGTLCAAGVVALASGVGLIVSAHGLAGDAQSADTLGASQSLRMQSERRWDWGLGTTVMGALLFSGGIGRYVWVSHSEQGTSLAAGGTF